MDQLNKIYSRYYSLDNICNSKTQMISGTTSLNHHGNLIRSLVHAGARILDFGAGTGELAKILFDKNYIIDGCEFSSNARREAKRLYGFKFYSSLTGLQHNQYDLVTAIEVIEHLTDPASTCRNINELLKPEGIAYITTPNTNGLNARIKKAQWREVNKPFHIVLFNYSSLKRMLVEAGFQTIRFIRFMPLTTNSSKSIILHRMLQFFELYGGLGVVAHK